NGTLEVDGATTEKLGELAAENGLVLHELSAQRASLEEAFMQMTAGAVEYHAHGTDVHGSSGTGPRWGAAAGADPDPARDATPDATYDSTSEGA
ncbi:ABC transporter ATP-binding protein, partial [Streptomyces sp. NPDC055055]